MQATLRVRDLVVASWETDRASVARPLPQGVEPAEIDGRFLVSLVGFHAEGGRLGRVPVLPYAQLNARTYVTWKGEPAVFFVAARVGIGGLPGALLRAPFRYSRLQVRPGSLRAPGLGVALRYRIGEPAEAGSLGRHELGLFENDGLYGFRIRREEAAWSGALLTDPARAEFLVALGFELRAGPDVLYAEQASFQTEVPPKRLE